MENNKSQEKEVKPTKENPKETPVSLCEDMNGHKFDNASYEKLMNEQKNAMKK